MSTYNEDLEKRTLEALKRKQEPFTRELLVHRALESLSQEQGKPMPEPTMSLGEVWGEIAKCVSDEELEKWEKGET
jgi:hypothetical protein